MTIGMLVAGIGCLLAGLLAIAFGIPINEFGLGNTLILAGAVTACTGLIILSLWVVVKELKGIAAGLSAKPVFGRKDSRPPTAALPRPAAEEAVPGADETEGEAVAEAGGTSPAPWFEEAATRDRPRQDASTAPATESPSAKPRRNLMFSSTSRRERERAQARTGDPSTVEPHAAGAPAADVGEPAPATFEDAWPKSERPKSADTPLPRRPLREPTPVRQPPASEDQAPVTVIKSGVVDGMAYSLYSDGSIEAQMAEGMMRFASIDELRAHLDQRS